MQSRLSSRKPGYGDSSIIEEIASQLGVRVHLVTRTTHIEKNREEEEDFFDVHFSDFLKHTTTLRDKTWKLVNTEVTKGYILMHRSKMIRMLEQVLIVRLNENFPNKDVPDWVYKELGSDIKEIKVSLDEWKDQNITEDLGDVTLASFPPCMKRLMNMTQSGENLSHAGRFALTTFLHHIGLSSDEILFIFSQSPDFDQSKTKYQIDHITGESSGTEYTPPECSTMKSNGVCYEPDALCNGRGLKHPLSYYRIKNRPIKKVGPRGTANVRPGQASSRY